MCSGSVHYTQKRRVYMKAKAERMVADVWAFPFSDFDMTMFPSRHLLGIARTPRH